MTIVDQLKTALVEREEELKRKLAQERIIRRENMGEVIKLISQDAALVITGVRRCGKSILAFTIGGEKNFGYVNFDDERLSLKADELNLVMEALYSLKGDVNLLIFDEIQNIKGWEKFVARLIPGKKIIIAGSNARLLSKELATHLTGRHLDFTLYPFSFREFLDWKEAKLNLYVTRDQARIKEYLKDYLEKGGFPLAYKLGNVFLIETYQDIIERDIIQRYQIKYRLAFKELARYLLSHAGKEITYNSLRKLLQIKSVHTIKNYISYLQNAYFIFSLERFSFKLKEQILAPKKVYCIDNGFIKTMGFQFSQNRGRYVENLVALELLKNLDSTELYYWKDHQQNEVDFVIKNGRKVKKLIQVHAVSSKEEVEERELKSLLKASRELQCANLSVITWDYAGEEKLGRRKIIFIPLWKWLLT